MSRKQINTNKIFLRPYVGLYIFASLISFNSDNLDKSCDLLETREYVTYITGREQRITNKDRTRRLWAIYME